MVRTVRGLFGVAVGVLLLGVLDVVAVGAIATAALVALLGACALRIRDRVVLDTGQLHVVADVAFAGTSLWLAAHALAAAQAGSSTWWTYALTNAVLMALYASLIPVSLRRTAVGLALLGGLPLATFFGAAAMGAVTATTTGAAAILAGTAVGAAVSSGIAVGAARTFETLYEARLSRRYKLLRRLGAGGMGEVWLAEHEMLARLAALKTIKLDASGMPRAAALERFEREARTTASLRSPHTVEIYDYGTTEAGTFFYAMEYLEGMDLDSLVRGHGAQPQERVIYLLSQACASLAEAHDRGLVHRDVKPANLFLARLGGEDDFLKVLDFGIVTGAGLRVADEVDTTISGTPAYMAPEMVAAPENVDARADLYSLGCVAFFLLTGEAVFATGSPMGDLRAHMHEDPRGISQTSGVTVSGDLEAAVMRCLRKDRSERFASARELAGALARCEVAQPWSTERAHAWWQTASV